MLRELLVRTRRRRKNEERKIIKKGRRTKTEITNKQTTTMKLEEQGHINDEESKWLDYRRRKIINAPKNNETSAYNRPYYNPDNISPIQEFVFDTSTTFANDYRQHINQCQEKRQYQ